METRPLFIAEASSNHGRDLDRARAFVDAAADAGCDAVKFQLFKIDRMFAPEILSRSAKHRARAEWELPLEHLAPLAEHCSARNIQFSCTPFYLDAVEELAPYVDFLKVASYELLVTDLLEACAATIGLSGNTAMHFWATLITLGVGWNFGFVGASALVLETHRPQERNKVQAFNDFLVFGAMAIGSFSSGQLLANYGWAAVNKVVYPPVLLGLVVLMLASFAKRRARLQAIDQFPDPGM